MRSTASSAATRQVRVVHHFGARSTRVCSRILHDPTCALPPPTQSSNRWPPDRWPSSPPPALPQWVNAGQSSAMNLPRMSNTRNETCALLTGVPIRPTSFCAICFCSSSPVRPPRRLHIVSIIPVSWPSAYERDSLGGTVRTKW